MGDREKQTITIDYQEYRALYAVFVRAEDWDDECLPRDLAQKVQEMRDYYLSIGLDKRGILIIK